MVRDRGVITVINRLNFINFDINIFSFIIESELNNTRLTLKWRHTLSNKLYISIKHLNTRQYYQSFLPRISAIPIAADTATILPITTGF